MTSTATYIQQLRTADAGSVREANRVLIIPAPFNFVVCPGS